MQSVSWGNPVPVGYRIIKSMKHLERLFIVAFASIMIILPVHAFLSTWLGIAIGPLLVWKSWKEILLALLVPLLAIYLVRRPAIARIIFTRRINQLIAAFVVLHGVLAVASDTNITAVLAGLMMNLRFFAMFILAQIIVESKNPWISRLKTWTPRWVLGVMVGLAVAAILQVTVLPEGFLLHFGYNWNVTIAPLMTVDREGDAMRAFATMRGPNTLGAYLLIGLALAGVMFTKTSRRVLVAASAGLGLIALGLTGSRSAWVGLLAMIAVLAAMTLPKAHLVKLIKYGSVPAVVLLLFVAWASVNIGAVRQAVFHSSPGDDSLFEGSTELHWQVTTDGLRLALQHPLGMGPGNSGPATYYRDIGVNLPENYFVQIWQEIGILGLVLFVVICWLITKRLYRARDELWPRALLVSFVGLTVVNVFLHGWADDPTAMTWWGLAGLFAFTPVLAGQSKTDITHVKLRSPLPPESLASKS